MKWFGITRVKLLQRFKMEYKAAIDLLPKLVT